MFITYKKKHNTVVLCFPGECNKYAVFNNPRVINHYPRNLKVVNEYLLSYFETEIMPAKVFSPTVTLMRYEPPASSTGR